jgi:MFS family permease
MVKTFPKSELVRAMSFVALPGLIGPMLGPLAGGLIVTHFHWSVIFFVNVPIGLAGLYLVYRHLPDFREPRSPFDLVGFILFGAGIALLSYVLEVFGEHALSGREMAGLLAIAGVLLAGYAVNSARIAHPLLRTVLFKVRTFRAAVSGSFFSRLGIGGVPFLFPLLYQAGLGFSATHAGLLMMVPASAAFSLKLAMPRVLARFGYRGILVSNTMLLGAMIMLFATIGADTPGWLIVMQLFLFGACASLQYTSMNTLVYADVADKDAGGASTIASTSQQLSVSFAVALASLAAAIFVPEALRSDPPALIGGIHKAFLVLGALTIVSSLVFVRLRPDDGNVVSRRKAVMPAEAGADKVA